MHHTKCEFHCHSKEDPVDKLKHSAQELVDKAAQKGFGFIALTLHQRVYLPEKLKAYAENLGILMVPSVELRVQRKDVLVINAPKNIVEKIQTFDDLRTFKQSEESKNSLIIAPHPHYVLGGSMGRKILKEYADCFDAVELSHFFWGPLDPAIPTKNFAKRTGKPAVATSDAHCLDGFGRNFCLVETPPSPTWEDIRKAVIQNKFKNTRPGIPLKSIVSQVSSVLKGLAQQKFNHDPKNHH